MVNKGTAEKLNDVSMLSRVFFFSREEPLHIKGGVENIKKVEEVMDIFIICNNILQNCVYSIHSKLNKTTIWLEIVLCAYVKANTSSVIITKGIF